MLAVVMNSCNEGVLILNSHVISYIACFCNTKCIRCSDTEINDTTIVKDLSLTANIQGNIC